MKGKYLASIFAVFAFVALVYAGTTRFSSVQVKENLEVVGTTTIGTVDVTVSTPTAVGQLVQDASHVVYISTGTASVNDWQKVGTQS